MYHFNIIQLFSNFFDLTTQNINVKLQKCGGILEIAEGRRE